MWFPHLWADSSIGLSKCLHQRVLAHLTSSSYYPVYSSLTQSIHSVHGLPIVFFHSSSLPITFSVFYVHPFFQHVRNHLSLLSSIWFHISFILRSLLMCVFLIQSLLDIPTPAFRNFISTACNLLSCPAS
jgi:hypothetical protein